MRRTPAAPALTLANLSPRVAGAWQTVRTMRFLIRVVVNAFAIWVVTLIPALMVTVIPFPPGDTLQLVLTLLLVAAIFALVNTLIGTVIKVLAFPLYILTLGLISLLVNGLLLLLAAWISSLLGFGLTVEGFWTGVLGALVLSLFSWVMGIILRPVLQKK